ncbi:hypothetical protein BgiMline_002764 [Biomphalaria glabrata]|nr:hypothetical protein BgiMline_011357 [Biomphalaria glabrata]
MLPVAYGFKTIEGLPVYFWIPSFLLHWLRAHRLVPFSDSNFTPFHPPVHCSLFLPHTLPSPTKTDPAHESLQNKKLDCNLSTFTGLVKKKRKTTKTFRSNCVNYQDTASSVSTIKTQPLLCQLSRHSLFYVNYQDTASSVSTIKTQPLLCQLSRHSLFYVNYQDTASSMSTIKTQPLLCQLSRHSLFYVNYQDTASSMSTTCTCRFICVNLPTDVDPTASTTKTYTPNCVNYLDIEA